MEISNLKEKEKQAQDRLRLLKNMGIEPFRVECLPDEDSILNNKNEKIKTY